MQPFELSPFLSKPALIEPSFEVVQGWEDEPSPLRLMAHPCAPLLELELMRQGSPTGVRFAVRGPEATVGRYSNMTGPVDVDLAVLQDHERFRIGLPHLRIVLRERTWRVEPLTWAYATYVEGEALRSEGATLEDQTLLSLGNVLFRVHVHSTRFEPHQPASEEQSRLRLKRNGAPGQTRVELATRSVVVGRYSPTTGPVDVDLGGMDDAVRVYVARRHARFFVQKGRWYVEPMGVKGPVFINRNPAIREPQALLDGDEVALGNVMFVFEEARPGPRRRPEGEATEEPRPMKDDGGEGK